jgi:signal peptidase I
MNVLYFYLILLLFPYTAMWWKIFPKAGRKAWEAWIPLYNYCVASKIGGQPFWYGLLMIIPGIHLYMWAIFNVALQRRFGFFALGETATGIFFPWLNAAKIANDAQLTALGEGNWENEAWVQKRSAGDHLALFLALPVVGHAVAYILGFGKRKKGAKTAVKEWGDAILFALIAATGIRTYVFEPFQIPTGSMEKTLLIGDFLFVNKLAYGPKVPVTPLSFPLVHNTIPVLNIRSYTTLETSNYTRLPGWSKVERNDVVVFNFPSGDTAIFDPRVPDGLMGHDYHGLLINNAWQEYLTEKLGYNWNYSAIVNNLDRLSMEEYMANLPRYTATIRAGYDQEFGLIYRPVDKRENYIKRCVAIPGDKLEIRDAVLYINGEKAFVPENVVFKYRVDNFPNYSDKTMWEKYAMRNVSPNDFERTGPNNQIGVMSLTNEKLALLKKRYPDAVFTQIVHPKGTYNQIVPMVDGEIVSAPLSCFPHDPTIDFTTTNFGPLTIPKKGVTIKIDASNIALYRRIITAYEGHQLEEKADGIYIDGKKSDSYTFGMNYYWLMGDNRDNSADSRIWGFVPEDHVVGRAALVWLSIDQHPGIFKEGVRWNRVFKMIQ